MVELAIPVGSVASVWQSPLQVYIGVTLRRVNMLFSLNNDSSFLDLFLEFQAINQKLKWVHRLSIIVGIEIWLVKASMFKYC